MSAISCVDSLDCVAVGTYVDTSYNSQAIIYTETSGTWTYAEAPLPPDAAANSGAGENWLRAVDCPQIGYCIAGGSYNDATTTVQPLVEVLDSGTWTPSEGPVPTDAIGYPAALISGIDCPTEGTCVAVGEFGGSNGYSGMLLTQSGDSWDATDAPLPPILDDAVRHHAATELATAPSSSLTGVGCSGTGFCASGGTEGSSGLVETGQLPGVVSVEDVVPGAGVAGGVVSVNGSNFTTASTVQFGSLAAPTTFVSPSQLQAIVPSGISCGSSITVVTNGFATASRSGDRFVRSGCTVPGMPSKVKATTPGDARASVTFGAPATSGGEPETDYVVTAADLTAPVRGGQVGTGTSSPIVVTGLMPGDTYDFTVVASNTVGPGRASPPSNSAVPRLMPLSIVTPKPGPVTPGKKYLATLKATGGFGALTWSLTAGTLPSHLALNPSGVISGTLPKGQAAGTYPVTVTVTDLHQPTADAVSATFVVVVT